MPPHLTVDERDRIAQLHQRGALQNEIAKTIGRCPATVCRELKRNRSGETYCAAAAQRQAECRRSNRPLARKMDDPEVNQYVRSRLAQEWSPEQIAGRAKDDFPDDPGHHISAQTIYDWIEQSEDREHWKGFLRRRGKRLCRRDYSKRDAGKARIDERPQEIEDRLRLGDWEGDTVLGPPGTGGLATLVDRQTRFTIVVKIKSKNADHVHGKIRDRLKELEEEQRRSVTFDNGTEFAKCYRLEKHLGMKLYFAQPGCPYQRGSNENTNGLIRQYFPKGTNFRDVTHHEVQQVEKRLNDRPRACLGFRTPKELFSNKSPPEDCV